MYVRMHARVRVRVCLCTHIRELQGCMRVDTSARRVQTHSFDRTFKRDMTSQYAIVN